MSDERKHQLHEDTGDHDSSFSPPNYNMRSIDRVDNSLFEFGSDPYRSSSADSYRSVALDHPHPASTHQTHHHSSHKQDFDAYSQDFPEPSSSSWGYDYSHQSTFDASKGGLGKGLLQVEVGDDFVVSPPHLLSSPTDEFAHLPGAPPSYDFSDLEKLLDGDASLIADCLDEDMTDVVSDSDVPGVPIFFDRNTSFCIPSEHHDPQFLFELIRQTLVIQKCDVHDCNRDSYKIRGASYYDFCSSSFVIHLFYRSQSEFLVEVQRRSGDSMVFSRFYRVFMYSLHSREIELFSPNTAQRLIPRDPPSLLTDRDFGSLIVDEASLSPLLNMAESPYVQTRKEAALILARASTNQANLTSLCAHNRTIHVLKDLLASPDVDVARLGITCCANLGGNPEFIQKCTDGFLEPFFELLTKFPGYDEVLRHLCRILAVVSFECSKPLTHFCKSLGRINRTSFDDDIRQQSGKILENISRSRQLSMMS